MEIYLTSLAEPPTGNILWSPWNCTFAFFKIPTLLQSGSAQAPDSVWSAACQKNSRRSKPFVPERCSPSHMSNTQPYKSQAGPQGWLCTFCFQTQHVSGSRFLPSHRCTDTLPRPMREPVTACWFLLCLSAPACYCSPLVPPASHRQRTSHLSSKKAPCTTC